MNRNKILRGVFFISFNTIVILVVLELILRIIFPSKVKEGKAFQFHPDSIVSLKPSRIKFFKRLPCNGGELIKWRTNSDGFRGPELKKNPKTRVIVYGDSNVQARFSTLKNTFVYQLQTLYEKAGFSGTEILNAGIVGAGPDQSLIRLQQDYSRYKPNVVIFHLFADNDFGDVMKNRLFHPDQSGKIVKSPLRPKLLKAEVQLLANPSIFESLLLIRALRKLAFLKSLTVHHSPQKSIRRLLKETKNIYAQYRMGKPRVDNHFYDFYDFDVAINPGQESAREKIRLMEHVLRKAHQFCQRKGCKFVVLIQPSAVDLTTNFFFSYKDLKRYPGYQPNALTHAAVKICTKNKIPFLNLFPNFLRYNPSRLFFKKGNNHWNDLGQSIAAKATFKYLTMRK